MIRTKKVAITVCVLALLLGIGVNMQVSALTPKVSKDTIIRKRENTAKEEKINAEVNPEDDKTSIKVKDMEIWPGDEFSEEDLFVSSTYSDGDDRPYHDITLMITGYVNTLKPGDYYVKFIVLNCVKEEVTATAHVKVKFDETNVVVKDSTINVGDEWKGEDNYVSSVDYLGKETSFKDVRVTGTVDTSKSGTNTVYYRVYNYAKEDVTSVAEIHVKGDDNKDNGGKDNGDKDNGGKDNGGKDNGDKDNGGKDNGDKDNDGKDNGDKDNGGKDNGGKDDGNKDKHPDKTSLEVKDIIIYVGDKWQASDNLVRATNKDGKPLYAKDMTVEENVDTSKAGKYEVIYTIFNRKSKKISKKAEVTVKAKDTDEGNGNNKDGDDKDRNDKDDNNKNDDGHNKDDNNKNDDGLNKDDNNKNKDGKDDNLSIGGGAGSDDGGAQLPKTGYDISIIAGLIGLAGLLGGGGIYLNRRQAQK